MNKIDKIIGCFREGVKQLNEELVHVASVENATEDIDRDFERNLELAVFMNWKEMLRVAKKKPVKISERDFNNFGQISY